ncbi:MAG: family 16 glycosylhydrolase [Saprospiraceae bacterium]|nr:family 16 glycosylhydrolase [Candidatus Opimibacter skivensis]
MLKHHSLLALLLCLPIIAFSQTVQDDFEGNGTITTWYGDNCNLNTALSNPFPQGINTSATVMEYGDVGGQYANVGFDVSNNFDLSTNHTFTIKIYVPSDGLTGNQNNQVSLKLQDGTLNQPWITQSEIIKPITLNQWQTITFDFEDDDYINLDNNSLPPTQRTDFNRVLIQVNGENNFDHVRALIDDIYYDGSIPVDPVYDYLVWSDEFDTNGAIDNAKWFHQTQLPTPGSWYNGEVQHYTNRTANAVVEDGILKIIAKKESFTDQGYTKQYTSARLNSKYTFTYGRVEVRAKLPFGVGTWPAIWTLGKNINENGGYWDTQGYGTTGWPACGEIDIMEHWGTNQNYVQSAIHTPSSFGGTVNLGGQSIPTASTEFHDYTFVWTPDKLVFSVDGNIHYTYNPLVKDNTTWPFDADQYLLLNVAIQSVIDPTFTQSAMEIDYVRVYQESPVATEKVDNALSPVYYPNPVDNELNITFENSDAQNVLLKIYSSSGKLIRTYSKSVKNNIVTLDNLDGLSSGMYVVMYVLDGKHYSVKFIKS